MLKVACPSCGAEVVFQNRASVFATCAYCTVMVVRHDKRLEALGKVSEEPNDLTALQLGTEGQFEGRPFRIVGRVRWRWEDGYWNEWCLHFASGTAGRSELYGWLGEAQGLFCVSFPLVTPGPLPRAPDVQAGKPYQVGGRRFLADDVKLAEAIYCEGELPAVTPVGERKTAVDLADADANYASIEYPARGEPSASIGRYVEADELQLKNTRTLDGW